MFAQSGATILHETAARSSTQLSRSADESGTRREPASDEAEEVVEAEGTWRTKPRGRWRQTKLLAGSFSFWPSGSAGSKFDCHGSASTAAASSLPPLAPRASTWQEAQCKLSADAAQAASRK